MTTHRHVQVPFKLWKQHEAARTGLLLHTLEMRLDRRTHPLPKRTVRGVKRILAVILPRHKGEHMLQPPPHCHTCHAPLLPDSTFCPHCLSSDADT